MEEKSEPGQRKRQLLPYIPKYRRNRDKTLDFLPCGPLTVLSKTARHLALGERVGAGGVYSASRRKDPTGQRGPGRQPATFAPRAAHRQVLAPPGAPSGLCAARAGAPMPGGTAAGAGRAAGRRRGREEPTAPVPRAGRVGAEGTPRPGGPERRARLPHLPSGKIKDPRGRPCPEPRLPTPWLPTAGSHSNPATKVSRLRERLVRSFPWPLAPSPPAPDYGKQQETELATCRLPRPPSPPWPGQRAQSGCPAPRLPAPSRAQASRDAARPTHHGDSRRGRAAAGSRCRGARAGTQTPGRTSKVGSLRQNQALDTQALTGANGNPGGTPSRRDPQR